MAKVGSVRDVPVSDLIPYAKNAKTHDERQVEQIAASIKEFGFISPCLIDKKNNIIAGHGRVKAAQLLKLPTVPCVDVEGLTEEQRRAYILADNKLTELGGWDAQMVSEELSDLRAFGFDIDLTGFTVDDIIIDEDAAPDITEAETVPDTHDVHRGDVWQLGKHRMMCGDSTKAEDVATLTAKNKIDLLLTDPPYNVALGVGDSPEERKKRKLRKDGLKIENDAMDGDAFVQFLTQAFTNAAAVMKPGAACYIWYATTSQKAFQTAMENADLLPHQIIIWVKNIANLGRQDYQWRHEPCFYGWKEGGPHYFIDVRSFTTVWDNTDELSRENAIKVLKDIASNATTTLYEDKPTKSELHPTMKPVPIFEKQIRNSSKEGDNVLDIFGGSGTTIMAAEHIGRRAFVMEYDTHYADVILTRWEKETGKKAKRIKDGGQ